MQTNQLPPPLHWTVCVCVHCVCIACALRAMPICIRPRQGLVTAHDRYASQTGAGVHCAGLANVYRAEARTLPYALRKMRLHCVLCIFALRFMRVHCVLCVYIAFYARVHCVKCVCIALNTCALRHHHHHSSSSSSSICVHCVNACALRKMCVHCVLCVRIVQNVFALRFVHLCIAFYACALRFKRVYCVLCMCALQ